MEAEKAGYCKIIAENLPWFAQKLEDARKFPSVLEKFKEKIELMRDYAEEMEKNPPEEPEDPNVPFEYNSFAMLDAMDDIRTVFRMSEYFIDDLRQDDTQVRVERVYAGLENFVKYCQETEPNAEIFAKLKDVARHIKKYKKEFEDRIDKNPKEVERLTELLDRHIGIAKAVRDIKLTEYTKQLEEPPERLDY